MNNSYTYPGYQGNNIRMTPNRVTNPDNLYRNNFPAHKSGRMASFYLSFPNSSEWRDTIFKGTIQEGDDDYTIISDSTTGKSIMFWNKYIDYVIFEDAGNN